MKKIFIDTNIWVYASYTQSPWHHKAIQKLNDLQAENCEFYISVQVLREYARVTTSEAVLSYTEILNNLQFFRNNTEVLSETSQTFIQLEQLISQYNIKGKSIFDANIVATMLEYDIKTLLTHNTKDFSPKYDEIITTIGL